MVLDRIVGRTFQAAAALLAPLLVSQTTLRFTDGHTPAWDALLVLAVVLAIPAGLAAFGASIRGGRR